MVKIAVMMVAYNAEKYIEDAISSVLRQRDAAEFDVIVVNDGSTDSTPEIVRRMANDATEIRLIDAPHQGVSRARNVALTALADDTDFVTFLDSDDLSPEGRFARDLAHFSSDPTLDLTYGSMQLFRKTGQDRFKPGPGNLVSAVRTVALGMGLYRYEVLRDVGLFDISFEQAEDMDLLFRIFERAPRFVLTDEICLYYRRHETNITRDFKTTRRDFSRAIMKAVHRRKHGNCAPLPKDLFTGDTNIENLL